MIRALKLSKIIISRVVLIISFISCISYTAKAQAGAKAQDPIYVVDMQRIINESVIGKAARNNVEEEIKKKKVILDKSKLEVDKIKEDIEKQSSLLSPEAIESKKELLSKKQRDFERAYQDQREDIARKNNESMMKVVSQIEEVIKEIATKNSYKFVMEKDLRVIVYVNDKYDISSEVIKILNTEKLGL